MRFANPAKLLALILCAIAVGCGSAGDDLLPSGDDKRPSVTEGIVGPRVGQLAPDFTVVDAFGDPVTLGETILQADAVVLYFTMWCPICDSHLSHLRENIIPRFPDVAFFAVDYVSGSVADARSALNSHGFATAGFRFLVDLQDEVESLYHGTMGTTVVVDFDGVVRLNEDYKDGDRLRQALEALYGESL